MGHNRGGREHKPSPPPFGAPGIGERTRYRLDQDGRPDADERNQPERGTAQRGLHTCLDGTWEKKRIQRDPER